ncbi:MAG TPA: EamA family transporter, partial [Gammaproteobacteria bacterium]|nr:EamA family transporter [Gammaproteobacteria bacterium]
MAQGRVFMLTALAMLAFAANSMLCRMALKPGLLDPASCISLRLASGALMLWLLLRIRAPGGGAAFRRGGDWTSALALFVYAAAFTFAYV